MPDPIAVNSMFGRIAHRYDLANRVLSGGIDIYWRFQLVQAVKRTKPTQVLDLATGSGDVAFALNRALPAGVKTLGMDFCQPMLDEAELKKPSLSKYPLDLDFRQGDGLNLPLADARFNAVTIAFGLRNMADRARCLKEMHRVLRPGGNLFILEFSQPWGWVKPFYYFHLRKLAPKLAGLLTGDQSAYEYLGDSISTFPGREALSHEIRAAGFTDVTAHAMTMGVVALHVGRKSESVS
ncbi:MAG TPA: bifunctional demethylmenaquinone methyltransferase/2-methoxy-6-polyprenyl-1,4-benzoquinol methylase UbiE [Opitutaceae bacterium]|nr:bifunctional demethylmenaquinone methyltransferase/2-methoxy-6-polyprenyl-1,4-benzoquinol methylase UbiE [Opitutaceae bacterium]